MPLPNLRQLIIPGAIAVGATLALGGTGLWIKSGGTTSPEGYG